MSTAKVGPSCQTRARFRISRSRSTSSTSRGTSERAERVRPPPALLADLVREPSGRVRAAVIAVLLARPHYAEAISDALERLSPMERQTLLFLYTAAHLLQQRYAARSRPHVAWRPLPDRFAVDLNMPPTATALERLAALGDCHSRVAGCDGRLGTT